MENRRDFIKKLSAFGGATALSSLPARAFINENLSDPENLTQGEFLTISGEKLISYIEPLARLKISSSKSGVLVVMDGAGKEYVRKEIKSETEITAGGAIGTQLVFLCDRKNRILDLASFRLNCKTEIRDEKSEFHDMMNMLEYTCRDYAPAYFRMEGKTLKTYAGWFQDHVHVFKAMKYFDQEIKSGIDLWAMGQRENGMLADNCYQPLGSYKSWLTRFGNDFVWKLGDDLHSSTYYIRIPVENMSEFTFLEAVYYAWKASGDDAWMEGKLQNCIKAVDYATSDPYRWSEKFKLLKRGYTIDIWDFQSDDEAKTWGGDFMMAKPGITEYSVMYGDNVGMSVGCKYLGEMLEYAGRNEEAEKFTRLGEELLERLNELSWTGEHYLHHVEENPDIRRDFGDVDVDKQVTISSAYAINRRIGSEKSKALIKTYQRIRKEMPATSPGEFYLCYPPYERGWHNAKWEYMNGGVSPIVGGELAHGAFWNGFEKYGVDCLRRMNEMAQISGNFLKCIYRGAMPDDPVRNFTPLDLRKIVNADTHGKGAKGVPGFTGEGDNDLANFPVGMQEFHKVPFDLIKPETNGRKACLIISSDEGYGKKAETDFNAQAKSFYILHTQAGGDHLGQIVLNYEDGSRHSVYITSGKNIAGWWFPSENPVGGIRLAASVSNGKSLSVGAYIFAFNNPHPDKKISKISFEGAEAGGKWIILGMTASDYPVYYTPDRVSYGAPDNWAAAAVIYAILEGLAGMKDTGVAFRKAVIAPRWEAAGIQNVSATAKYESSGGYASYLYSKNAEGKYDVVFTGNSENTEFRLLLPENAVPQKLMVDGVEQLLVPVEKTESSHYLVLNFSGVGVHHVELEMA